MRDGIRGGADKAFSRPHVYPRSLGQEHRAAVIADRAARRRLFHVIHINVGVVLILGVIYFQRMFGVCGKDFGRKIAVVDVRTVDDFFAVQPYDHGVIRKEGEGGGILADRDIARPLHGKIVGA